MNQVINQVKLFCGDSMANILNLSIKVTKNPSRVLSIISNFLIEKQKRIRRIVEQNDESIK